MKPIHSGLSEIAAHFGKRSKKRLTQIDQTLTTLKKPGAVVGIANITTWPTLPNETLCSLNMS
jgi:hypothetical protein